MPAQLPTDLLKPAKPIITSVASNRSARLYSEIVNQFDIHATRYAGSPMQTRATTFVWDVTSAMSAEVPAQNTAAWLTTTGVSSDWVSCTFSAAWRNANDGRPTLALWTNPTDSSSVHVAVVVPSSDTMRITMADTVNRSSVPLSKGFGTQNPTFFIHP